MKSWVGLWLTGQYLGVAHTVMAEAVFEALELFCFINCIIDG